MSGGEAMAGNRLNSIAPLRQEIRNVLDALIPSGSDCALIDFPNHSNVGDSAIWLGEVAYLKQRKCRIRYSCDAYNYNPQALCSAVAAGATLLMHGGGNFGDLYPLHQKLRERVVRDFPGNRIILLPQSIHFSAVEGLERSKAVYGAHQDLHILIRDTVSLEFARRHYSNPIYLCPDMALMVDFPPLTLKDKIAKLVILSRTDQEKLPDIASGRISPETRIVDWLDEPEPRLDWLYRWAHRRLSWNSRIPRFILNRVALFAANSMAWQRLDRGLDILGEADNVITDRLHALILSWLGGSPVLYVDNSYGKLSNFVRTWFQDMEGIAQCTDFPEAVASVENRYKGQRNRTPANAAR